ncbi:hypothetical protein MBAV_005231 [Candidatus Magnetobacterium bavaricum]|uniref:Uncharacterized protein n=1 Tax=Candidatus Magnetobacterium bavaricum TaxID=29290 RepID=A0A0F3GKT3_9BACT|nr:hypothetical protein MBAV_005231 [Candidatus Magnetobacterium bavaricum]
MSQEAIGLYGHPEEIPGYAKVHKSQQMQVLYPQDGDFPEGGLDVRVGGAEGLEVVPAGEQTGSRSHLSYIQGVVEVPAVAMTERTHGAAHRYHVGIALCPGTKTRMKPLRGIVAVKDAYVCGQDRVECPHDGLWQQMRIDAKGGNLTKGMHPGICPACTDEGNIF